MPGQSRGGSFPCPHCGAEVRHGSPACPNCGSDEATGWAEDAHKWGAGVPTGYSEEDEFDYDEFIRREFGRGRPRFLPIPLWLALLLAALLLGLLAGLLLPLA
ncbi:MAG: zinc-ribbon domain-containing protein [Candidatus Brocadiaceae bacterium]|jgi:hypothetical protein